MHFIFTRNGAIPRQPGGSKAKLLKIMRLSAVILFATCMHVSARGHSQAITLKEENAPLEKVFRKIERQTGFLVLYTGEVKKEFQPVSIEVRDATIYQVLKACFENQPLRYSIVDKTVVVTPAPRPQPPVLPAGPPPVTIRGTVKDSASGRPLAGVTIQVKGSSTGTVTGGGGQFSLDVPENTVLIVSYLGYNKKEIYTGTGTVFNIALSPVSTGLNQLVVIGYGTQKKSDLTGAVASIDSKDFVKGVTTDALQLLAGKASGVNISQANAEPGGNLNIRIRGAGSINSSNAALIVIDGLPAGSTANINPADIKSVEVLKDASAAAIYGTRAANGVVLITTKSGQQGPARVSYNTYWAYQTPASKLNVLNATQYMQYLNAISQDQGLTLPYTDADIAAAGKGTDWQDELFRNAMAMNQQISVSGGSDQVKYYTSLRYLNQKGIMVSSGIKQYNATVNLEVTPSPKFKFGINMNGNLNLKNEIADQSNAGNENADPLNAATQFDPTLSPKKNADGQYETNPTIALDNPVALAYGYDYREQNNRLYGNTYGEYEIIPGLKATARLGGDMFNIRNDNYQDQTTQQGAANGGIANVSSTIQSYWLAEGLLNYDRVFGPHHISLMGGTTWEKFVTLAQTSRATGFLSDVTNTNLLQSGNSATQTVTSSKTVYSLQSFFGRANYTFRDRYLLTATVRRDGTSRFSEEHKYATFPSIALGWRISEEPFMKAIPKISNLKLRLSYGQMGNEGIGNFATISTYVAGGNTVLGGQIVNGAQPARLPNPDLKWETTAEYNLGVDFGLFDNRISGSVEYYTKKTFDQLFDKPVPTSTGFSSILTNFGSVRNAGFDVSLTTQNLTGKLHWTSNVNFSTLKNKVVQLPPYIGQIISGGIIANIPGFALVEQGYPMYAFYGYKVTGIFQQDEDIAHSAQPGAKPGEPKFLDKNGDGKIDASDRVVLGSPFPKFTYSFTNTFTYKNLSLSIFLMGVQGIKTFNGNIVESMFPINFNRNIMSKYYLRRWTPETPNTGLPSGDNSSVYFGNGKMINTYSIQAASFLRLKNISLSYEFPLRSTAVFRALTLTLVGENVFTITNFDGYDPDANQAGDGTNIAKSSYNNYPLARVFSLGASVTF
jgi:TonB-linked SusC/RagA family outer membrane protein